MTPGSALNSTIELCASTYKIYIVPRDPRRLSCSVWSMVDPHYHDGVLWRQNSGGFKAGRSFVRTGPPGLGDFMGFKFFTGQMMILEGKAGKDKISPNQAELHELAHHQGALAGVVSDWESCAALFESWGFRKR